MKIFKSKEKIINEYNYLASLKSLNSFYPSLEKDSLIMNKNTLLQNRED